MKNNARIGILGEDISVKYLESRGYDIIERNFRQSYGELDIITSDPDRTLVFIEVKTMKRPGDFSGQHDISPQDNMSPMKISKTQKIAWAYANAHPELLQENRGWRIDLIAITVDFHADGVFREDFTDLTDMHKYCEIKHFENVN